MTLLTGIGRLLAAYLTRPSRSPYPSTPTDPATVDTTLRVGDVLLVEGNLRISVAIKYLTQSTWSHAALCVKAADPGSDEPAQVIEADAAEGVRIAGVAQFDGLHMRICRPVGLSARDAKAIADFAIAHVGDAYDLANVVDLARYLIPTPPVPGSWKRRMIALGSGDPTRAICSTLVAQSFQSIRYPILPEITHELANDPACKGCVETLLHIRHHSLFTPRDFDVSPYFQIIKPTLEQEFDYRKLTWDDDVQPRPIVLSDRSERPCF